LDRILLSAVLVPVIEMTEMTTRHETRRDDEMCRRRRSILQSLLLGDWSTLKEGTMVEEEDRCSTRGFFDDGACDGTGRAAALL
jgi:hypothetical protein